MPRIVDTAQRDGETKKNERVSWQLEAAILDWVKSVILVTLYQQQRRDKRVRGCLCWETPAAEREREIERVWILQIWLQSNEKPG